MRVPSILNRYKGGLLALGFFGLLTFLALDNLILHFGTAVPDSPYKDYAVFYWDLWWVKHALLDLHTNPMTTNYILFPNVVNLAVHTHVFTLGLISLPFQLFMDMRWIINGLVVLSFFLSAILMYVFLRRHVHNIWLSVLGAILYAFNPATLGRAVETHLHTLPVWWLPLGLWLWDLTMERRSVRWALAVGVCVYLAFMNYSELLLWMLLTLLPYMLYGLLTQATSRARWQVIGLGTVAALAALLPALIVPLPQLWQSRADRYPWEDLSFVHNLSLSPAALFTRTEAIGNNTLGQTLPVLVLVSLALTGKRRERWLWLGVGLIVLILAFGPYLNDLSQPLPFMLIYTLAQGQYRTPARLVTPATLGLVVFVIWSLADVFNRLRSQWAQAAIVTMLIAIYCVDIGILAPFPIITMPDYPVYRLIGADSEDHTLLQVPLGASSGVHGIPHVDAEQLTYYARFHHQRTINGLIARLPAEQLERFRRSPFLLALAQEMALPPFEESRAELVRRLRNWDIRYIVVHKDLLGADRARLFIEFFNQQPELCVFYNDAATIAYRAITLWTDCPRPDLAAPSSSGELDLGKTDDVQFVGTGWYDIENVGGLQARWAGEILTSTLRLVLPSESIHARIRAMAYPVNQTVTISVNGQPATTIRLSNDWVEYSFTLPADAWRAEGPSFVTLAHARLESAFERTGGASLDKRPLAAAYDYLVFEPVR